MSDATVRAVIVDFGGVICSFDYGIFCTRLADRIGRPAEQILQTAFGGALQVEFESGRLTGPDYHRRLMDLLDADITYDEFFPMYGDIFTEVPGTADILRRLHSTYPLYLLSDTNEIHFGYVRDKVDVLGLFSDLVLSHEVGAMKPSPLIYAEVLARSGVPPQACVFIDDRPTNVDGARRVGMRAVQFVSPEQCAAELSQLGVSIP